MRLIAAALVALAGCASQPPASPQDLADSSKPLICTSSAECARYWKRATVFVTQTSPYRIRLASDTIIETFGPLDYTSGFAMRVTREPVNDHWERLRIFAGCWGTCPIAWEALDARFKRFVKN